MSDFFEQRRQALGVASNSPTDTPDSTDTSNDFFSQRKMDLGIIPDTRPQNQPPTQQEIQKYGTNLHPENSQFMQQMQSSSQPAQVNNSQDMRTDYPGGLFNPLNDLGHLANLPLLRSFDNAAGQVMGVPDNMMNSAKPTGSPLLDKAVQLAGGAAGLLTNPAQIEQNVGQAFFEHPNVQNLASIAGNKAQSFLPDAGLALSKDGSRIVSSLAGKTVNNLVKGSAQVGLGSAAYAPFQTLNSGQDLQDIPKNMLEQGLQGAAFGGVLGGVSPSLSALIDKYKGTKIGDILDHYTQAASSRNVENQTLPNSPEYPKFDPNMTDPKYAQNMKIYGEGNPATLALPQGNYKAPTRLKVMNSEDSFNSVIPKVFQQATERMTPPFENQNELAKWVQGHLNDAGHKVSLNEVRKLDYTDLQHFADDIKSKFNVADVARKTAYDMGYGKIFDQTSPTLREQMARDTQSQVYGVPAPKVDIQKPQFNVQHEGNSAMPETKFKVGESATKETPYKVGDSAIPTSADGSHLSEAKKIEDIQSKDGVNYYKFEGSNTYMPENMVQPKPNESGVFQSLKKSEHVAPETIDTIKQQGDTTFATKHNEETLGNANDIINKNGINESRQQIMEKDKALNDDETAVAFKLLKHYQDNGDFESAASIAHKLMTSGTENGRAVQINAIFNKMTPEGAAKFAAKLIERSTNGEKSITPEQTQRITQFAKQFQTAAGNKELSQSAIRTINKLSNGENLTVQEADQLKNFAKYAAKNAPKPKEVNYKDLKGVETAPKAVSEAQPKLRDKVTKITSTQADKARERIKARGNRVSSTPFDVWADHAIVGADYIAKGAKTIADFTEKMTDDLGNIAYKNINRLYVDAYTKFRIQNKIPMTDFEKIVNKAISTHEIGNIEANAIKAKAIELIQMSGKDKIAAEAQLHQQFQELTDPSFGQKLASILRSSQLLNPRTTIRNVISNMMFYSLDTTVRRLSSVVDLGASKLTGTDRQIFWKNAPNIWKNFFGDVIYGAKEGYAGRNPGGFATQFDLGNNAFDRNGNLGERVGSFMERALGAVNKSMDYASANMAMKNELFQLAKAKVYSDGHRGASLQSKAIEEMHIASDKMLAQAKEYGDYMTFQDKNFLSDSAQKVKSALNLGKDFGLGNILLNYPKTPANILMRAIDYSPAGYIKFAGNLIKMASESKVDKKTLIQDFMRASGGTAMLWTSYQLAQAGLINVLPSRDPQVNSLERTAGIVANSVNVDGLIRYAKTFFSDPSVAQKQKGDYYASMDWAQPMAISASAGAAISQAQDPSRLQKGASAASAAEQSLEGSLESAGNMSVLKNIKQAIMGNSSNPNQSIMGRVGDIAKQIPPAFIPSVAGQIRNTIDPAVRDTQQGGFMQQVLNQILNKLPGLSQNLPQRVDTLGEPMKNQFDTGGRTVNAFLNPSLMGKYEPNQAAQVILKLVNSTGDQSLAPASPQKTLNVAGLKTKLTPQEYLALQTNKGQQIQNFINQNIRVFNDQNLSDTQKAGVLKELLKASSVVSSGDMKLQKSK